MVLALLLAGAGFLALPFAARRLETAGGAIGTLFGRRAGSLGTAILLGALLLRLPLLPLPLTLSEDVLRYLWDGRVAAAGYNPYALPPQAAELSALREGSQGEWRQLPHRDIPTVYPPLALAAFSISTRLPFPILSWKILATAADLAAVALLLALARRAGLPEARVVWYAWNPLAILESSGMGHVDSLGIAAALAAALLVLRRRDRSGAASEPAPPAPTATSAALAAACAAAGALFKLAPAAAIPMWSRQSGRSLLFLAAAGSLLLAAFLPIFLATGGPPPGLLTYGLRWEFNGPLFEPLWRLLDAVHLAPALAARLTAWKDARREFYRWNWLYPYLYPQLLAKLALGLGSAAAIAASLRERDPIAGSGRLFARLLLLSATIYPWYVLWVLPWAALTRHRAWLALSGLILLAYVPRGTSVPLLPWVFLAIWGPFALLLAFSRRPWSTA